MFTSIEVENLLVIRSDLEPNIINIDSTSVPLALICRVYSQPFFLNIKTYSKQVVFSQDRLKEFYVAEY